MQPIPGKQLQPTAEKFRCTAFVGDDVGLAVGEHRTPRRADVGERQRIRHRAGRYQEHRRIALEHLADPAFDLSGQIVVAITERGTVVGPRQRFQDFRRHAGGVVACKVHGGRAVFGP